jgi:hypothetical protein
METLKILLLIFLLLDGLFLLLGLWRPVTVLWWLDYQNRRRVLHYYGTGLLVLGGLWALVQWASV